MSVRARKLDATRPYGMRFQKLNARRWEWRDAYYWLLTLGWHQFSLFVFGVYASINVHFASGYYLRPGCLAELDPHSAKAATSAK